jgi:hypothetical protein
MTGIARLFIQRGADFRKRFLWTPGGAPGDATGCHARFEIRAHGDGQPLLVATDADLIAFSPAGGFDMALTIPAAQTLLALRNGVWRFDVIEPSGGVIPLAGGFVDSGYGPEPGGGDANRDFILDSRDCGLIQISTPGPQGPSGATDVKALYANQGSLSALTTTAKSSLVAAINELQASGGGGGGATILDTAGAGDTAHTWSADKSTSAIAAAVAGILGGASSAYDTLLEIQTALQSEDSSIANLLAAVSNRLRFDAAQTLTSGQITQVCSNAGLGEPETDFVAIYNAAKL